MKKTSIQVYLFSFLAIASICTSCLDKIDLEVEKGLEEGIVIRGELLKGEPSKITIYISSLFNFDIKTLSPINARSVFLINEEGKEMEIPSRQDGVHLYVFDPIQDPIKIDFGEKYRIKVISEDNQIYESSFEELMNPVEKGNLKFEQSSFSMLDEDGELVELSAIQFLINSAIKIQGSDENARIWWTADRTFQLTDSVPERDFIAKTCYITSTLDFDNIHLLDGTNLTITEIENYPLTKVLLNHEFAEGYYYTLYQKSVSEGTFEYWRQTKSLIEKTGNLLESPAGRINTNIKNTNNPDDTNIFGYFSTYAEDTLRLCILPEELNFPAQLCPPIGMFNCDVPSPCCDCLSEQGSQLEKPFFWKK